MCIGRRRDRICLKLQTQTVSMHVVIYMYIIYQIYVGMSKSTIIVEVVFEFVYPRPDHRSSNVFNQ